MAKVLTDADVRAVPAGESVELMRSALLAHYRGRLRAPARLHADLGDGELVFTVGRLAGDAYGFRLYGLFDPSTEQVNVVFDEKSGRVAGIVTGAELGLRRTGAIGGVAVDLLARPDAAVLAVVGTGRQAWAQVWATAAVRRLSEVRVFSRDPDRRAAFAAGCAAEFPGLAVRATAGAREAVHGADVVILGTTSGTPVIEDGWVADGAHVSTLGPKTVQRHECPSALAQRADLVVTDSPEQLACYGAPPLVPADRVVPLGAVLAGAHPGRTSDAAITLFISTGLAGTEVVLARALIGRTPDA